MSFRAFASFRSFALALRRASQIGSALALACLPLSGCAHRDGRATAAPAGAAVIHFTDVAQASGLRFKHTSGMSGRLMFAETVGSGCAIFDYNGDGRPDLFLV